MEETTNAKVPMYRGKIGYDITQLTRVVKRSGDGYLAYCPELDISGKGQTEFDARIHLERIIQLYCRGRHEILLMQRAQRVRHVLFLVYLCAAVLAGLIIITVLHAI